MSTKENSNSTEKHYVPLQKTPVRLQDYAIAIFNTIPTKSALKKAIKKKMLYVDGKLATTATFIHGGESIIFHQQKTSKPQRNFKLSLEIIYEDNYLALINKPAGIIVSGNSFKTIANTLVKNLKKSAHIDAVIPKPIHRLDFPTTGILLIGKTSSSIAALNKLFEDKKIRKVYYAVTIGKMDALKDTIELPIDDKQATTRYEIVASVVSKRFEFLNLLKLIPQTGRRHQLRKHLAALGNPILGDLEYGKEDKILKGKGLYLHAHSLEFKHPYKAKKVYFEQELPPKFTKLFDKKSRS